MDAFEAILTRRSTRKLAPKLPKTELIERVIDAGRHAPSGSNSQSTHFMVITSPRVLAELADLVRAAFAQMEVGPDTYVSLRNSVNASKRGSYVFHYGAPVLIVTANRRGYGNAMADSACALENMMIAANALDLGSCWINQLHWLDEDPQVRTYMEGLGLMSYETITGGLILGYAADGAPVRNELARTGNPVTWVEDYNANRPHGNDVGPIASYGVTPAVLPQKMGQRDVRGHQGVTPEWLHRGPRS